MEESGKDKLIHLKQIHTAESIIQREMFEPKLRNSHKI